MIGAEMFTPTVGMSKAVILPSSEEIQGEKSMRDDIAHVERVVEQPIEIISRQRISREQPRYVEYTPGTQRIVQTSAKRLPQEQQRHATLPVLYGPSAPTTQVVPLSPSFDPERVSAEGKKLMPNKIVLHTTEGSLTSAINTMKNPKEKKSYHIIVDREGNRHDIVPTYLTAWHTGNPKWQKNKYGTGPVNVSSIGIGFVGSQKLTPAQIATGKQVILELAKLYNIPVKFTKGLVSEKDRLSSAGIFTHGEFEAGQSDNMTVFKELLIDVLPMVR